MPSVDDVRRKLLNKPMQSPLDDLRRRLPDDFHRQLLDAALQSLGEDNPLRVTNFSTGFRELTRHVLASLAPDKDVAACSWYEVPKNTPSKFTRDQRISYILHGGLTPEYATDALGLDLDAERKPLLQAINWLSKNVHVNPENFAPGPELASKADETVTTLLDLLVAADHARMALANHLEGHITEEIDMEVLTETLAALDELSTHSSVDEVYVDSIKVLSVDSVEIRFLAKGSLGVGLQFGSNSDVRNDQGAVLEESFDFTCGLTSSVDEPEALSVIEDSLQVDTRDWRDNYFGADEREEPPPPES